MSDFESAAELSLSVPQRELRSVRGEIESALSDIQVGVDADVNRPNDRAVADGGGGRGERRDRQQFQWDRQRTEHVEDIRDAVIAIEDGLDDIEGGGGLGGVAGGGAAGGLLAKAGLGGVGLLAGKAGAAVGGGALAGGAVGRTINELGIGEFIQDQLDIDSSEWFSATVSSGVDFTPAAFLDGVVESPAELSTDAFLGATVSEPIEFGPSMFLDTVIGNPVNIGDSQFIDLMLSSPVALGPSDFIDGVVGSPVQLNPSDLVRERVNLESIIRDAVSFEQEVNIPVELGGVEVNAELSGLRRELEREIGSEIDTLRSEVESLEGRLRGLFS